MMKAHRFGDALIRPGSSTLLSLLTPALARAPTTTIRRVQSFRYQVVAAPKARLFSTTLPTYASSVNSSQKPNEIEQEKDEGNKSINIKQDTEDSTSHTTNTEERAFIPMNSRGTRSSFGQPRAAPTTLTSPAMQAIFDQVATNAQPRFDAQTSSASRTSIARMQETLGLGDVSGYRLAGGKTSPMHRAKPPPPVRMDAYMGRAEPVGIGGASLSAALAKLNRKLIYNNVRGDMFRQRFHERNGLKRKRLKSERWRKRFKEGFRAMILKVHRMKKQGW
jgi:small subunit ribosomal protein MRP21